jgi:thiol-disulfide isomerase/thioredoxin
MANIVVYVGSLLKPYYRYILAFLLLVVFITVARYSYQTYFVKVQKDKNSSNIANANNIKPITAIYFFHVDWCPHCVKAVPEWNAFVDAYNNKEVKGHLVQCYNIDCTDDNGDVTIQTDPTTGGATNISPTPVKISQLVQKYKIDSYPTIKLTKDNNVIDFEAKVTKQNLVQFVNSV